MHNWLFLAIGGVFALGVTLTGACDECSGKTMDSPGVTDLAKDDGVTVFMSSLHGDQSASQANDGIYIPRGDESESMTHTGKEASPWIQFDLGRTRCIKGIKIWNRSSSTTVMSRLKNVLINVEDNGYTGTRDAGVCAYSPGPQPAVRFHQCESGPMCGRYVRVTAYNSLDYLNLYEVEIHGW